MLPQQSHAISIEEQMEKHVPAYWLFRFLWNTKWSKVLEFQSAADSGACTYCSQCKAALRKRDRQMKPPTYIPPRSVTNMLEVAHGFIGSSCIGQHEAGLNRVAVALIYYCEDTTADGLSTKALLVKEYSDHLSDVFVDRRLMETLICNAHLFKDAYLVICGDGMDQAHWRLPRDPELKTVKALGSFQRPQCVLHMIWVFNVRIEFFILDSDQHHDSSMVTECMARTLEKVAADFESMGSVMPPALLYMVAGMKRSRH